MIHAHHVIFCAYGFWLPNDPRGSWSDFVGAWELVRFGRATRSISRKELNALEEQRRKAAKATLKYPAVQFTDEQIDAIAEGFAERIRKSNITVWACAILPEHVHMVVGRHRYWVEQVVNLLKGQATRQLGKRSLHPLACYAEPGQRVPKPWARGEWKVFLDSEQAVDQAIQYVQDNPIKEGRPRQKWAFVQRFPGLPSVWFTYGD